MLRLLGEGRVSPFLKRPCLLGVEGGGFWVSAREDDAVVEVASGADVLVVEGLGFPGLFDERLGSEVLRFSEGEDLDDVKGRAFTS